MPIGSNISLNSEMEPNSFFYSCLYSIIVAALKPVQHHLIPCTAPGCPQKMTMSGLGVIFPPLGAVADVLLLWDNIKCAQPREVLVMAAEGMGSASTLAFESQHLIVPLPGTGTQLHPWTAALCSLGLPLIDTPCKRGVWAQE